MSHSKFGWSYPPGCSGPPDDERECAICGLEAGSCECPECPVCGAQGDETCVLEHGLVIPDLDELKARRAEAEELHRLFLEGAFDAKAEGR